jgi:hypothetical protein
MIAIFIILDNRDNAARNDDEMQIDLLFHPDDSSGGFAGKQPVFIILVLLCYFEYHRVIN